MKLPCVRGTQCSREATCAVDSSFPHRMTQWWCSGGVALTFWLIAAFPGRDLDFLLRSCVIFPHWISNNTHQTCKIELEELGYGTILCWIIPAIMQTAFAFSRLFEKTGAWKKKINIAKQRDADNTSSPGHGIKLALCGKTEGASVSICAAHFGFHANEGSFIFSSTSADGKIR